MGAPQSSAGAALRLSNTDAALRTVLGYLAVALAGLVALAEVLTAEGPIRSIYVAYLFPAVGALYVATGLLAWGRRPANRLGSLMVACGAAVIASSFANTAVPVLIAVGLITATLPLSVLIHLVHACPTGVVQGPQSRITVLAGYVAGVVLQAPLWAFTPEPPPFDVLLVSSRPDFAELGLHVQESVGALVVVTTVWLLSRRLRDYGAADRGLLASLLGFAVLTVLAVAVGGDLLPSFGLDAKAVADVQLAAVALVPLGFLLVVLRGGFPVPGRIAAFAATIGAAAGTPEAGRELDRAVAAALGDPSAVLLRWADGGYVDVDGRPAGTDPGPFRSLVRIEGSDTELGAVVHDSALDTDPAMLAAVTQVAGIALERERLAHAVLASRAELQRASQRVLAAGDAERQRIARDLHDGLQGALVLMALQARELARDAPDDDFGKAATCLADSADAAASSLRDLVAGVLPSPLVERGLGAALLDIAEDLPLDVSVSVSPADLALPAPIETTAYFVIAEALTNVMKHARASKAAVTVARRGGTVTVEVVDDGVGARSYRGGTGLGGLRDRLAILGGTVEVTRLTAGTRVTAQLPCA